MSIPIYYCTYGATPHCAKENSKRSKDQTAQSFTNTTQSIMRQCVSAISVPEWGGWADPLSVFFFLSKLNKHLLGWSREHLLSSAPLLSCSLPSWTYVCSAMTARQTPDDRMGPQRSMSNYTCWLISDNWMFYSISWSVILT